MTTFQLILASSSPARRQLLASLELPFTVAVPDVDETPLSNETPEALVYRLALAKAQKVAPDFPDALIIASDQVCWLKEEAVSKPLTRENAIAQLQAASGKTVQFYTSLCVLNTRTRQQQLTVVQTAVTFRTLSLIEIEAYIDRANPLHCAGSFNAEGLGMALFKKWETSDPSALIGLPLIQLVTMLGNEGIAIL